MTNVLFPAGWLRVSAFVMAAICVAGFVAFISISGPVPKTIAYGSNPLFALYSSAPVISEVAGLLSVALGVIALRGSSRGMEVALVGVAIGILLFFFVTVLVANIMSMAAPTPIDGKGVATASFPSIVLSPPVSGIAGVAIAAAVVVSRLRGISGLRLAIVSIVIGGVVAAFWLFNLLMLNLNGE